MNSSKNFGHQGGYTTIFPKCNGQSYLTLGPDRLQCLLTFMISNIISGVLIYRLSQSEEGKNYSLILFCIIMYMDVIWIICALINPGIAMPNTEIQCQQAYCEKCSNHVSVKIDRKHCESCNACLDGQQHHCFLLGGCVAKNNSLMFNFLLLGLFIWIISLAATIPIAFYLP